MTNETRLDADDSIKKYFDNFNGKLFTVDSVLRIYEFHGLNSEGHAIIIGNYANYQRHVRRMTIVIESIQTGKWEII